MSVHPAISAVIALVFMAVTGAPVHEENKEAAGQPIPIKYPRKIIPEDDKLLAGALSGKPAMKRDFTISAPARVVVYLSGRLDLSRRLAEEYQGAPMTIEKGEDENEWEITGAGKSYTLRPLYKDDAIAVVRFEFLYHLPMGIGVKTSGAGALVFRMNREKTPDETPPDETSIDYDIYLAQGPAFIDRLMAKFPFIEVGMVESDFTALLNSFAEVCSAVADDPQSVAEDMENDDETWTAREVDDFRRYFLQKGKEI